MKMKREVIKRRRKDLYVYWLAGVVEENVKGGGDSRNVMFLKHEREKERKKEEKIITLVCVVISFPSTQIAAA